MVALRKCLRTLVSDILALVQSQIDGSDITA